MMFARLTLSKLVGRVRDPVADRAETAEEGVANRFYRGNTEVVRGGHPTDQVQTFMHQGLAQAVDARRGFRV